MGHALSLFAYLKMKGQIIMDEHVNEKEEKKEPFSLQKEIFPNIFRIWKKKVFKFWKKML